MGTGIGCGGRGRCLTHDRGNTEHKTWYLEIESQIYSNHNFKPSPAVIPTWTTKGRATAKNAGRCSRSVSRNTSSLTLIVWRSTEVWGTRCVLFGIAFCRVSSISQVICLNTRQQLHLWTTLSVSKKRQASTTLQLVREKNGNALNAFMMYCLIIR